MRRLALFVAGMLVTLMAGVSAQQSTIGGQSSRPTFQRATLSTAAPPVANSNPGNPQLLLQGPLPYILFNETDQAANNRGWSTRVNSSTWNVDVRSDDFSTSVSALQIVRSGLAVSSLFFGNATDNPAFSFFGTGTTTFNGPLTLQGSIQTVSNTTPAIRLTETDAATNNAVWDQYAAAETLHFAAGNNALSVFTDWLAVDRTGTTIDAVNLQAAAVQANGSNVLTLASGGNITVAPTISGQGICRADGTNCQVALATSSLPFTSTSVTFANATTFTVGGVSLVPSTATATGTVVGCTTAPTTTFRYNKIGNVVVVSADLVGCTSNSTSFSFTGAVPAAMQPTRTQQVPCYLTDNSNNIAGMMVFSPASSTVTMGLMTGGFTAAGARASCFGGMSGSYSLN